MTREQIAELRRLLALATKGPWMAVAVDTDEGSFDISALPQFSSDIGNMECKADAEVVAALRNNADAMLDDLDAKDAEIADLRGRIMHPDELAKLLAYNERLKAKNAQLRAELQGTTAMRDEAVRQHADDVKRLTETEKAQRVLDAAEFAKLISENERLRGLVDGFMAATEWVDDWPDANTAGYAAIREMRKKVTG